MYTGVSLLWIAYAGIRYWYLTQFLHSLSDLETFDGDTRYDNEH